MASVEDLGKKLKDKYPGAYDHLSDAEAGIKLKQKYPLAYQEFNLPGGTPPDAPLLERQKLPGLDTPGIPGQDPHKPGVDLSGLDTTENQVNSRMGNTIAGYASGGVPGAIAGGVFNPSTPGEQAQFHATNLASGIPGIGSGAPLMRLLKAMGIGGAVGVGGAALRSGLDQGSLPSTGEIALSGGLGMTLPAAAHVGLAQPAAASQAADELQNSKTLLNKLGLNKKLNTTRTADLSDALKETEAAYEKELARTGSSASSEKFRLAALKKAQETELANTKQTTRRLSDAQAKLQDTMPEKKDPDQAKNAAMLLGKLLLGGSGPAYLAHQGHYGQAAGLAALEGAGVAWPKVVSAASKNQTFGPQLNSWMQNGAVKDAIKANPGLLQLLQSLSGKLTSTSGE